MSIERDRVFVAVYVFLEREGQVFVLQRHNTGYMDGRWCPPAGGVDENESASECAVRECLEEAGVHIDPSTLVLRHTMHRKTPDRRVIDLFFSAEFEGEPYNAEPLKCAQARWLPWSDVTDWMDYIPTALQAWRHGVFYSEVDFPNSQLP